MSIESIASKTGFSVSARAGLEHKDSLDNIDQNKALSIIASLNWSSFIDEIREEAGVYYSYMFDDFPNNTAQFAKTIERILQIKAKYEDASHVIAFDNSKYGCDECIFITKHKNKEDLVKGVAAASRKIEVLARQIEQSLEEFED